MWPWDQIQALIKQLAQLQAQLTNDVNIIANIGSELQALTGAVDAITHSLHDVTDVAAISQRLSVEASGDCASIATTIGPLVGGVVDGLAATMTSVSNAVASAARTPTEVLTEVTRREASALAALDGAKAALDRMDATLAEKVIDGLHRIMRDGAALQRVLIPTLQRLMDARLAHQPSPVMAAAMRGCLAQAKALAAVTPAPVWDLLAGVISPDAIAALAAGPALSATAAGAASEPSEFLKQYVNFRIASMVCDWLATSIPLAVQASVSATIGSDVGVGVGLAALAVGAFGNAAVGASISVGGSLSIAALGGLLAGLAGFAFGLIAIDGATNEALRVIAFSAINPPKGATP